MKKNRIIKKGLLLVTFVTSILLITSCNNRQQSMDTKDVAIDRNEERFDDNRQKDAQFLVNAAEINLTQIQLGRLAQQKGVTTHVKELGKMMEDAHTQSQRDLTALAKSKMIAIPNSPTYDARDAYNKLNEKSGNDFEKAYADKMVDKHEEAIKAFEDASTDSYDADIKNWAIATLPVLRTNLNHSVECKKKYDEM